MALYPENKAIIASFVSYPDSLPRQGKKSASACARVRPGPAIRTSALHPVILILLCICSSCIEPFNPVINEKQDAIVIDGVITDKPGIHRVTVSHSTPYNNAHFEPLGGCVISVTDHKGNMEIYSEDIDLEGVYEAWLDTAFLGVGKSYSLQVITPSDQVYVSDYDTLLSCPPIDSLYFKQVNSGGRDPEDIWHGIQFYNDVRGDPGGTRNFRWKATATWVYHPPLYPSFIMIDGRMMVNTEDTVSTCYMTEPIATIFTASTWQLTENSIYQNRLHYVSDQTPRLMEQYSLLIQQHSLTDQAYDYWEQMAARSVNSGGLYESQPSTIRGNIYNVNNPSQKVLGYFYATQIQERRISVKGIELDFKVKNFHCQAEFIDPNHIPDIGIYYFNSSGYWAPSECFDCTLSGGDNEMPEFWLDR